MTAARETFVEACKIGLARYKQLLTMVCVCCGGPGLPPPSDQDLDCNSRVVGAIFMQLLESRMCLRCFVQSSEAEAALSRLK